MLRAEKPICQRAEQAATSPRQAYIQTILDLGGLVFGVGRMTDDPASVSVRNTSCFGFVVLDHGLQ